MSVVKEKKVEYLGRQIKQLREMVNNCKEEGYCNEQTIDIVRSYYNDIETYVYDPEFEEHHYYRYYVE